MGLIIKCEVKLKISIDLQQQFHVIGFLKKTTNYADTLLCPHMINKMHPLFRVYVSQHEKVSVFLCRT